jgi:hypothetical protein
MNGTGDRWTWAHEEYRGQGIKQDKTKQKQREN